MKILKALAVLGITSLLTISAHAQTLVKPSQGGTGIGSYTIGDIIYASASNILSKLGIGSDGTCLKVSGGLPAWGTCGGGGSGGGAHSTSTAFGATDYIFPNGSTNIYALGYDGTGVATSSNEAEYVADPTAKLASYLNGMKLGIGTTTPYAPLSVVGEILGSYFTATTTATSTLTGGLQTNLLRVTSATASSTFSNGINLTAGCFSINGTCVGGGGTGASTTLLADTNTWSGGNIFANTTTTNATSTSQAITNTSSALLQVDVNGSVGEYAGTSCTNQFVRSLSALGVATCAPVGASDVSLANLTATDSTLTFSGTYNGATARTIGLNLGNANTWTVNQTFNYSSSTAYSSFVTASTTNLIVNGENFSDLTGTGLAISGGALVTSNIPNASLQNSTISGVALGSNLNALTNDTTLVGTSYNGSSAISDWGIDLSNPNIWTGLQQFQGKASSTLLSVYNGLYVGTTGTTTILGTATSTFGAGVEATYLNITGTSATSTFARGINLAGGCFAINGTCIGGSGSSASTTLLADSNTFSGLNAFTNSGTTSFTGGIATTRIDTSATSTLAGLRIDSGGLQISTLNCSGLANGGTLTTDASGNVTCADDDGGAGGGANSKWATSTGPFTNAIYPNATGGNTLVGIGTSTPIYQLTIASSTASQIGLTDGSLTSNQFAIRNAGGIFYVASSSPLTGATSSPLFTINGTTGDVSFGSGTTGISLNPIGDSYFTNRLAVGTTTQYSKLTVWGGTTGNIFEAVTNASSSALTVSATGFGTTTLSGLSISGLATSTSNVGFNITGGCFAINGTCISGGTSSSATTTAIRLQGCSPSTQSARFAPGGAYWGPLDMTNDAVDQWAWYMVTATSSSITCKVQVPQNLAPTPNPRLVSVFSATTTTVAQYALDIDIVQYNPSNGTLDPAANTLTNILAGSTTAAQRLQNRNTAFLTVGTTTSIGSTLVAGNTMLVRFTYWGADADDTSNTDLLFLDDDSRLLVDLSAQ